MRPRFWSLLVVAALLLVAGRVSVPGLAAHAQTAAFHVPLASCASSGCNGLDAPRDLLRRQWRVLLGGGQRCHQLARSQRWLGPALVLRNLRDKLGALCVFIGLPRGLSDAVQGPLSLSGTGRTNQEYLPATKAAASVLFHVGGRVFSGATTGCSQTHDSFVPRQR